MRYEYLREFADTDTQERILDALKVKPTIPAAAAELGITERSVLATLQRIKKRAAKAGVAPEELVNRPLPMGQNLKGVTYYTNDDGDVIPRWIKTEAEKAAGTANLIKEAYSEAQEALRPEKKVKTARKCLNEDLCNLFIITDYHLGMLAWGEETGADWDLKIAEDMLYSWFLEAIRRAPAAKYAILGQIGDLMHYDSLDAVTPASGNILDADSRFSKVVRVCIRVLRRVVRLLAENFENVHIIHAEGNHDPASSIWLRELSAALYEGHENISVETSPDPYYCYEFGDVSLFFHHGHKRKPANIHDVFAAKFREVFGRTRHSFGHMGHLHHRAELETNLMIVEQHRTLAAADAYAARGGWVSGRASPVITYHRKYGEVARSYLSPDMLR